MGEICIHPVFLHFGFSNVPRSSSRSRPYALPVHFADCRARRCHGSRDYIRHHLNLSLPEAACDAPASFGRRYGTTLKGLETLHGVDRDHYCDFIQDIDDLLMPPPDPALREWLIDSGAQKFQPTSSPMPVATGPIAAWPAWGFPDLLLSEPLILRGILEHWIHGMGGGNRKPEAYIRTELNAMCASLHGDAQHHFRRRSPRQSGAGAFARVVHRSGCGRTMPHAGDGNGCIACVKNSDQRVDPAITGLRIR